MKNIPYIQAPPNACALGCYTMTAKYFFPEVTFGQIAEISQWEEGYVVWAFKFWLWIMDKGIKITEYDTGDLQVWADKGEEGLRQSVSSKAFQFFKKNSKDLNSYTEDIQKILNHPNFTHYQRKPIFEDLNGAFSRDAVCEVVINLKALRNEQGLSLHRVVITDIYDEEIRFHDPHGEPNQQASKELFLRAWSQGELCVYEK